MLEYGTFSSRSTSCCENAGIEKRPGSHRTHFFSWRIFYEYNFNLIAAAQRIRTPRFFSFLNKKSHWLLKYPNIKYVFHNPGNPQCIHNTLFDKYQNCGFYLVIQLSIFTLAFQYFYYKNFIHWKCIIQVRNRHFHF